MFIRRKRPPAVPVCLASAIGSLAVLAAAMGQDGRLEVMYEPVPVFEQLSLDGAHRPAATDDGFLVLDRFNHRLLHLDVSGTVRAQIGQIGQGDGELRLPMDYAIDPDGALRVVTAEKLVGVHTFAADGAYVNRFHLGSGGDDSAYYLSFSVAVDSSERVFLSQPRSGDLLTVYSVKGKRVGAVGDLLRPDRIFDDCARHASCRDRRFAVSLNRVVSVVTPDNSLVVAFTAAPVLRKYSPKGQLEFDVRLTGSTLDDLAEIAFQDPRSWSGLSSFNTDGIQVLQMIMDVAVDPANGRIYCLVAGGEILVVSPRGEQLAILVPGQYGKGLSSLSVSGGVALLASWSKLYRAELPRVYSPAGPVGSHHEAFKRERGGGAM